ncbi:DUF255 domain-containing protein [Thermogymnomonas acidicola]|uniref:DUF255 domain-containing protein n=1 Tax=Thermogymnomonas acidicola TaxID=399579 RepID=UPI0013968883|nr:DUF255 domain-containing protein [Thermogymnomonas acidicola]
MHQGGQGGEARHRCHLHDVLPAGQRLRGGWPLNVVLTPPSGKPLFALTYIQGEQARPDGHNRLRQGCEGALAGEEGRTGGQGR